ncbi:hypothetical protein GOP47_0027273 [Adiantum capillus-veneris]|nr:hypothetical protein GOP47_0027273 [Adiantum capillus-veneris]
MVEQNCESPAPSGLLLRWTPTIQEVLQSASNTALHSLHRDDPVPYKLLRDAWFAASPSARPPWRHLLAGSTFVFKIPQPREKSDELKARLARLQDVAERKAYDDLVKDVIPRQFDEMEYFSSYRNQLGFGLHVVVLMFTGYLVGYFLFRSQFGGSSVLHAAGGISGMVVAMLIETVLFIIRATSIDGVKPKVKKAPSRSIPKKD